MDHRSLCVALVVAMTLLAIAGLIGGRTGAVGGAPAVVVGGHPTGDGPSPRHAAL